MQIFTIIRIFGCIIIAIVTEQLWTTQVTLLEGETPLQMFAPLRYRFLMIGLFGFGIMAWASSIEEKLFRNEPFKLSLLDFSAKIVGGIIGFISVLTGFMGIILFLV